MKLQELHEGAESAADKIAKGLKGIKGVKVVVSAADYDDLDGNPLPETYKVKVTYTPDRGVKPTEVIKFYKTADGDWEYLSDGASQGYTDMAETIAALRKDIEVGQKFHGKSSKVDEEYQEFDWYQKAVLKVLADNDLRGCHFKDHKLVCKRRDYNRVQKVLKHAERMHEFDANGEEFDMPEIVAESTLTEGYEMKVLKAADAGGVRGCFFKGGTLFCDEGDYDRVVKLLKKAEAKGDFDMPNVAKIKD